MRRHREHHNAAKIGWLRAAVLGANDGIVSTASLIVGVAAANTGREDVLLAGFAGLVAGAMSMAAGEFVSVSTQRDSQRADLATERRELHDEPQAELDELTAIYVARGLSPELAQEVAKQLTAKDALAAHARDELGLTEQAAARPLQAAFASAISFAIGAALPLLAAAIAPATQIAWSVSLSALAFLALLGFLGAQAGGAKRWRATARVTFWGAAAMAITACVGASFGAVT